MPGKDTSEELLASKRHFPNAGERQLDALVADWVGEDAAPGVLGKFHRQPKPVGDAVDRFLMRIHQDEAILLEKISNSWQELVGVETSKQLTPLEIKGNTLVVSALNQTYLYVYRAPQMKEPLLQRLMELTDGRIQNFRIVTKGRR